MEREPPKETDSAPPALRLVLASPAPLLRLGLGALFANDPRVAQMEEAATLAELDPWLSEASLALLILDQTWLPQLPRFPACPWVALAAAPDLASLQLAYREGAMGYLSLAAPLDLLRGLLQPPPRAFLLDPTLTPWLLEQITSQAAQAERAGALTPREQEIAQLLAQGLTRRQIAERLYITSATLKTHLRHLAQKRAAIPHLAEILRSRLPPT